MTVFSSRPRVRFFAGPSIRWSEIEELCTGLDAEVEIAPPVEQGDLLREAHHLPEIIGIIDGYFYQVPSVLHKEILIALAAGSHVLGAASLGALRAAELDVFGMEGVGRIYEMFSDELIDGDDEVAVQHGPEEIGFRPLTIPLVNIRHAIHLAATEGVINRDDSRVILSAAQDIHFTKRTWNQLFEHDRYQLINGAAPFREFVTQRNPDLKNEDARVLVQTIVNRVRGSSEWPDRPDCRVKSSKYTYLMEHEYVGSRSGSRHIPDSRVVSIQKVLDPCFAAVVDRVARRIIAVDEATFRGLAPDATELLEKSFREENDLPDDNQFCDWLLAQGLRRQELTLWLQARNLERQVAEFFPSPETQESSSRILHAVASRRGLGEADLLALTLSRQTIAFDAPLVRELKCTGQFAEARVTAASVLSSVDAAFDGNDRLRAIMEAMGDLARNSFDEWASHLWGIPMAELPSELLRRAIHSGAEFIDTVRLCKLHTEHQTKQSGLPATSTSDGSTE